MTRKVILSVGAAVVGVSLVLSIIYGHIEGSFDVVDDFANWKAASYHIVSMGCAYAALYAMIGTGIALGIAHFLARRRANAA
jgi:hypothetical protein